MCEHDIIYLYEHRRKERCWKIIKKKKVTTEQLVLQSD